jgi:3-methyladenine DNA glycosylase AlkC
VTAKSRADVSEERRAALNAGDVASTDLVECLVVDHVALARAVLPKAGVPLPAEEALAKIAGAPLKARLAFFASLLARHPKGRTALATHASDTVRSWVTLAYEGEKDPQKRLLLLRPFAADPHFGVREYAWMAYRSALLADLDAALAPLLPWTTAEDANLRRFAAEATRPRGVWCAHLRPLRSDPRRGLPILEPLARDPARYVQLSVANWLNDASKDDPAFVEEVTARWLAAHRCPETVHIATRALRTLRAKSTT